MPKEWSELEERRRTWWAIFCSDRLVSATTGWPTLIDENDVRMIDLTLALEKRIDNHL